MSTIKQYSTYITQSQTENPVKIQPVKTQLHNNSLHKTNSKPKSQS